MKTGLDSRFSDTVRSAFAFATDNQHGIVLAFLLLLHVLAVFHFFPPAESVRSTPLLTVDYPVHTYRVHMYREGIRSVGVPWGYDPAVSAGTVMNPGQDLGAKAIQVAGLAAWFLEPGAVVRLFLFCTLLMYPLLLLVACRRLGLSRDVVLWAVLVLLIATWLLSEILQFLEWGLVTFYLASFFSVVVLALFLDLLQVPSRKRYAFFVLSATLLFLLHITGPITVLPAMGLMVLTARLPSWRWRVALVAAPVAVFLLNAFWVVPYLMARDIPVAGDLHLAYPPDVILHLTYADFSDFLPIFSSPVIAVATVAGIALSVYGLWGLAVETQPRVAVAIGITCLVGVLLVFFGSFVPVVRTTQPLRFIVPALGFMTLPVGMACSRIARDLRSGSPVAVACLSVVAAVVAVIADRPVPLEATSRSEAISAFIESETDATDRLLIQSWDGYNHGGYETKIYPMIYGREVIGSNFQLFYDPPQFLSTMLLGREIGAWEPEELLDAINRWGVSRVFTVTEEAESLMKRTFGQPGMAVGEYRAFDVPGPASRFLRGEGILSVAINRMQISDIRHDDGLIVLRYRYHPAWRSPEGVRICSFPVPEDSAGFIALVDPPSSTTLTFDTWALFSAPWPEPGGPGELACPDASDPVGGA